MSTVRVTVIDDDPTSREETPAQLVALGCEVVAAVAGPEALEAADLERCDLTLTDLFLQGTTGFEVLRCVRAINLWGRPTSVVVVTACPADEYRRRCLAAGFDDFLPKPVSRSALRAVIDRVRLLPTESAT